MSRIGERPIMIPKDVKVEIDKQMIIATGAKGKEKLLTPRPITVKLQDNKLIFTRVDDSKPNKALHGLTRSLALNLIEGVQKGFLKRLEVVGVGFRAQMQANVLNLQLGFSHPINFPIPEDIKIETPKQNQIIVEGANKARVGQIAAQIRDIFPPEPYKGKGIRYVDEYVRRKVGKVVTK